MNPVKTDFLIPRGSFAVGAGSIMNIAGVYFVYNTSSSEEDADARAIYNDWRIVGQDIEKALAHEGSKLLAEAIANG